MSDLQRAALYARFSPRPTHKDIERSETLDTQLERMTAYCQLRGLDPAYRFADPLISGRKPLAEREDGAKLVRLLKTGKVKHVIAQKLDRIFRNEIDGTQTEAVWRRHDIALHLADQGGVMVDTGTATGWLIFKHLLIIAEFEPRQTAERTRQASRRYQANGKRMSCVVPYGMMLDQMSEPNKNSGQLSGLVANVDELAVIDEMQHWHRVEGLSLRQIARRLDEMGIPCRKASHWCPQTVSRILRRLTDHVPD